VGHWENDTFIYYPGDLKYIAYHYKDYLCSQLPSPSIDSSKDRLARDMISLKVDFDRALNHLGRGFWSGTDIDEIVSDFPYYRYFGRYQRVILADVLGVDDSELEAAGFTDISRVKGRAYKRMCHFLNGST
jgi:hypothetical protein